METAGFDFTWVFIILVLVLVLVVGAFALALHFKGVPKAEIPKQVALKATNVLDTTEEELISFAKRHILAMKGATLQDAYWDRDDFMKDLGRVALNPEFTQPVVLDGQPVKPGTGEPINYYTQTAEGTKGNISLKNPTGA